MDTEKRSELKQEAAPPVLSGDIEFEEKSIVAALLKEPQLVAHSIAERRNPAKVGAVFLACAVVFHAVFGFAVGLFGGWEVAIMDAVKAPLIAVCSLLLCFPSLYVFACVGGTPLSIAQAFMLGSSCLAMIGLLLVGLAPVAWLFAVSTNNVAFVVVLTLVVWLIATGFAIRYIVKLEVIEIFRRTPGIKFWFVVLVVVTLQMVTCMRPILSKGDAGSWWTGGKKFFISHFVETIEKAEGQANTPE